MKNSKGMIFVTVIAITGLMIFIIVAASNMILQDTHMIKRLRYSTQAQYLAEAGISDVLATLATKGFSEFGSSTPSPTLGDGTYSFTVKKYTVGGEDRWLASSQGTVSGISRTATIEIKDVSSPTMKNALSAGTNIAIKANAGNVTITGDIHANNDLTLKEQGGELSVVAPDSGEGTGKATSSNKYSVDSGVSIADPANSGGGKPRLGMPIFRFDIFKQVAIDEGVYYNSSKTFVGEKLKGGSAGIIYVDGDVIFTGKCRVRGGFVAKGNITLNKGNSLTQASAPDTGNRFPIFMSEQGSRIKLYGEFTTEEENIIYATNDIQIETPGAKSMIAGTVIAGGSFKITANNDLDIKYGEITSYEALPLVVKIVSWNR
ncbi:MAG: hypothetical protein KAU58_06510 [Candidatus Omnitrophica bacterium]|nr:hypothetical protein [Candidatus Omnitrophota bacterium]